MSKAATVNYREIVSRPAPATYISFHGAYWENYEDLLDPLGEANGPPVSDNDVESQVLTQISKGGNQLVSKASTWMAVCLWEEVLTRAIGEPPGFLSQASRDNPPNAYDQ
jgi:hypothetical protein